MTQSDGLGFRLDGVEVAHVDPAGAAAVRCSGAGRRAADMEAQERRRNEVDDLPAIDVGGKSAGLDSAAARRWSSGHVVRARSTLTFGTLHQRGITDGGFMDEGEVGEVQEIVDDQAVRRDVEVLPPLAPQLGRRASGSR